MEEEEAERERQEQAKFNAIREMARRRATMPQEPVPNPKARMRVMAKQTLSMPRLSLDLQVRQGLQLPTGLTCCTMTSAIV